VSLLVRLAAAFAAVALITAAAVAIATPIIVGRGFAQIVGVGPGAGGGQGGGNGPGPGAGIHAQQVQQDTIIAIIVVAVVAAAIASVVGVILAQRIATPLRRLRAAADAVAGGELDRRSGLAGRRDEIGSLGRSFDTMAAELEESEASRRRFFQDVVHELKTPLAVIDATASAVLDGVYEHDTRHLETIRSQSRLLARIVDDLRTISLAEAGQLPLRVGSVDVGTVAATVARDFAARAAAAGSDLRVAVPGGLVAAADPDRLQQALAALMDNALRHVPSGGGITIEGTAIQGADARVRIAVRDTGPGVPEEDRSRIFARFYQADPARDRATGTTGLGLSIVKALVEAQGGSVGVDAAAPHGAIFWLELPAATAAAAAPPAPAATA
jgi:two-component system sensor histidine kinase BaeS